MPAQRIASVLGTLFFALVASSSVPSSIGLAQSPGGLYGAGSDPIAPLPQVAHLDRGAEEQAEQQSAQKEKPVDKDKEKDEDDLDKMLEMTPKQLSEVSVKSPTASPAMNAEVSTVSRTESTVGRSPAAVYVLTNEMIRRSGARNVPEALRLVPGIEVAQVTTSIWAISIRGFNGVFANKLLVQIDGRAVYTPGFGGVHWDQQQVLLEDVERIEVIRGPGGTIWGANAVNGVINIITKSSTETHGIYVASGGGNQHRSFNNFRVGGREGDLNWRVYGMQADDRPNFFSPTAFLDPPHAWDAFQYAQGGFRMDWTPNEQDTLTLQGDFLGTRETYQQNLFFFSLQRPEYVRQNNFLGRWSRQVDEETDWAVQLYYDDWMRTMPGFFSRILNLDTFDLDTQYHTKLGSSHDVVCGFGYRNYKSLIREIGFITYDPPLDTFDIISYFVQDTIELRPDRLFLTAGIKLQHNDFTNFEYQPTIRLLVTPDDRTAMWGAVSRAVRTPAVNERDVNFFFGFIDGNKALKSEDLIAYELGIRRQPTDRLYWDLAAFFNRYDNLIGVTPLFPILPEIVSNVGYGDTYGYELAVTYEMNPNWRLRGIYTFLVEDITYPPGTAVYITPLGTSPRNQFSLQSGWDLSPTTKLDMIWRYCDRLPVGVPHYFVMDVRLAWQPSDSLEVAVVGQNLLDNHHPEFYDFSGVTEVPSGVYGMLTWRY